MESDVFFRAINLMRYICNSAAEGNAFKPYWGDKFRCNQIDEHIDLIKKEEPYNTHEFWKEVFGLPESYKILLGFRKWSEDMEEMCIPIWIWQLLPDDMMFDGTPKKDLNNDTRFGCVFWKA